MQSHIVKQTGRISREDREKLNQNRSFTIWFTGLSGAGKTTIALALEEWLHHQSKRVFVLDGDNTRLGINSDLTFSKQDRKENIRRVGEICRLFNDAGIIVIACFISPFQDHRSMVRTIIGTDRFLEIFLKASLDICIQRDVKGLYKLALEGKIGDFTGISSPYEDPVDAHLKIDTGVKTEIETLETVKQFLIENSFLNGVLKCNTSIVN